MLLQSATEVASQTSLSPLGAGVQIIQLLHGTVTEVFQMSSRYICLSALVVKSTTSNNTVKLVWCVKPDETNIVLTTHEGFYA